MIDPVSIGVIAILVLALVGVVSLRRRQQASLAAKAEADALRQKAVDKATFDANAERCSAERRAQQAFIPKVPQNGGSSFNQAARSRALETTNRESRN